METLYSYWSIQTSLIIKVSFSNNSYYYIANFQHQLILFLIVVDFRQWGFIYLRLIVFLIVLPSTLKGRLKKRCRSCATWLLWANRSVCRSCCKEKLILKVKYAYGQSLTIKKKTQLWSLFVNFILF